MRGFVLFLPILIFSCTEREEIRTLRVPKRASSVQPAAANRSIVVAIAARPDKIWFFKMTGTGAAVTHDSEALRSFLASVHFVDNNPAWTLPDGWQEAEAAQMQFAAFRSEETDITVTGLPAEGFDLAANINRWRGQIGLDPIDSSQIPQMLSEVPLAEGTATWVSLIAEPYHGH